MQPETNTRTAQAGRKSALKATKQAPRCAWLFSVACLFTATVNAQSLDINWQKLGRGQSADYGVAQSWRLKTEYQALLFDAEQRRYQVTAAEQRFTHLNPGLQYLASLNDDWHLWPTFRVRLGFSDHINSRAVTYNPQLALIHNRPNGLAWVAGIGVLAHDADTIVYPIIGFVFSDAYQGRWSGNITIPEASISYQLTDSWSIDAGLKWQTRFYANQNSFDRPMATLYQQDILPSVGVRYQLTESVSFSAKVTSTLDRRVRLYDQQGQLLETFKPNNEAGVLLGFHWTP